MKLKKRLLIIATSLCITLPFIPINGTISLGTGNSFSPAMGVSAASVYDSGTCGDNLTWVLDDQGTLTISGQGDMEFANVAPWKENKEKIARVIINDGVTSIDKWAFYECSSIVTISIPSSVSYIGACAFMGCSKLSSISLPKNITSIETFSFERCGALVEITIPDNVTRIGEGAFRGCTNLQSISLPSKLKSLGEEAFNNCSSLTSLVISGDVDSIGNSTFLKCSNLTTVVLPDSVEVIAKYAFDGCTNLESISIPDSVTTIDTSAFRDCSSLKEIHFPQNITMIGNNAFCRCSSLESIVFPSEIKSTNDGFILGGSVFDGTPWLKTQQKEDPLVVVNSVLIDGRAAEGNIVIPDSVQIIGQSAFRDNRKITSVIIPKSVNMIYESFPNCEALESVTIYNSECSIQDSRSTLYNYCTGTYTETAVFNGTIYGYENSTAEHYAQKYNYSFKPLDAVPDDGTLGDIDGSGTINASDAANVLIAAAAIGAGNDPGLTDAQKKAADVNSDSSINATDAAIVLQYAAAVGAGQKDVKITDFVRS